MSTLQPLPPPPQKKLENESERKDVEARLSRFQANAEKNWKKMEANEGMWNFCSGLFVEYPIDSCLIVVFR